jgi:hypothetical protein
LFPNIDDASISGPIRDVLSLLRESIAKVSNGVSDPLLFSDLSDRAKANMVWDAFTKEAERRFEDHQEIRVFRSGQLVFVQIGGLNIRIKKADADSLRITRNKTRQTMLWTNGRQVVLPGFEYPSTQLFLTYCPDEFWTRMDRCVIGVYLDDTPVSYRELDLEAEAQLVTIYPSGPSARPAQPLRFKETADAPELPLDVDAPAQ